MGVGVKWSKMSYLSINSGFSMIQSLLTFLFAFISSLLLGKLFIALAPFFASQVRKWTPASHQKKNNTPTMGGIFILASVLLTSLIFNLISSVKILIFLLCLGLFGFIGLLDDWGKITHHTGISARKKFLLQWLCAALISTLMVFWAKISTVISFPLAGISFDAGLLYIPWAMFIIVACSNAVNLTDGLDGLAGFTLLPNVLLWAGIAYCMSEPSVVGVSFALGGSLLGFLAYNYHPARVFMGDIGALSLGAGYALLALMLKQELLIPLAGIVFVWEEVSVMLQVFSFKIYKKRIFKIAPFHHHLEMCGWSEWAIVSLFSLISIVACAGAFFIFYQSWLLGK